MDKRRDERFAVKAPVVISLNRQELKGTLADLSLGGARVHLNNAVVKLGSKVVLTAVLPPSAPVTLHARVVWSNDTSWGLALEGPSNPRVVGFCRLSVQRANAQSAQAHAH
jgi:hypothetical protein